MHAKFYKLSNSKITEKVKSFVYRVSHTSFLISHQDSEYINIILE